MLYQWTKFKCHTLFLSQDTKHNVLLSSIWTVDDVINFKIFLNQPLKQQLTRKKRGEDECIKI